MAAVTSIGGHYSECERLAAYLNLPVPFSTTTYQDHLQRIPPAVHAVATESTKQAGSEAVPKYDSTNIAVSVDGTWQRSGFKSKNGIVTVLYVKENYGGSRSGMAFKMEKKAGKSSQ